MPKQMCILICLCIYNREIHEKVKRQQALIVVTTQPRWVPSPFSEAIQSARDMFHMTSYKKEKKKELTANLGD